MTLKIIAKIEQTEIIFIDNLSLPKIKRNRVLKTVPSDTNNGTKLNKRKTNKFTFDIE